jgi:hypothetical protein
MGCQVKREPLVKAVAFNESHGEGSVGPTAPASSSKSSALLWSHGGPPACNTLISSRELDRLDERNKIYSPRTSEGPEKVGQAPDETRS